MNDRNAFFAEVAVKAAPCLAELRDMVLSRSKDRTPKWKFRLAPDLAVMIQAKADGTPRFECELIEADGVVIADFLKRPKGRPYSIIKFRLYQREADDELWQLKPRAWRESFNNEGGRFNALARTVAAFNSGAFDVVTVRMMLTPCCLACGKALVDTVSMARGIGPECAATTSTNVGRMVSLGGKR